MRALSVPFPCSYTTVHQQQPQFSRGTPSNVDADRHTHDHPIQRTQTIEFAPSPQPRHRASRDKSRLHDSTSEMVPGHPSTEVSATEYGDRAFSTAAIRHLADKCGRILCQSSSSASVRVDTYIPNQYNIFGRTRLLWRFSGPTANFIPTYPPVLSRCAPPT